MGLNEDLGDRENVGNAALSAQRAREAREKKMAEIPEDLKERYKLACGGNALVDHIERRYIERIATLEADFTAYKRVTDLAYKGSEQESLDKIKTLEATVREKEQKYCSICKGKTDLACADCRMDLGVTLYVCAIPNCRDEHEKVCPHNLKAELATLREEKFMKCGHHVSCRQEINGEKYCEFCYRIDCWQQAAKREDELRAQVERLQKPVSDFKVGEIVRVDADSYKGQGFYECEQFHRIGVRLEHGHIRWYDAHTVTKLNEPAEKWTARAAQGEK